MSTSTPRAPRAQRELLGAQVERAIRELILRDGLAEGDPLPSEGELAERLGVSKSTVREAVRRLETLGYLRVVHGVGLRVAHFSIDPVVRNLPYDLLDRARGLREILEVRTVIEESFLVRAAERMTPEQLDGLDEIVARMEAGSTEGEVDPDIDAEFHEALYHSLDNSLVTDLIRTFWQLFHSARTNMEFTRNFRAVQEHRQIVDALRDGDELQIRAAMRRHFRQLQTELDRTITQETP